MTSVGVVEEQGGTETILLAEDDGCVRGIAARALTLLGYTVLEAAHGVDALQIAMAHPAPIHLLVTDVVMPHLNGRLLADELRRARPELRVLFVSGYAADTFTGAALQPDIPFMAKPYVPTVLARRVREALDANRPRGGIAPTRDSPRSHAVRAHPSPAPRQ